MTVQELIDGLSALPDEAKAFTVKVEGKHHYWGPVEFVTLAPTPLRTLYLARHHTSATVFSMVPLLDRLDRIDRERNTRG